jgi:hypothetical protein
MKGKNWQQHTPSIYCYANVRSMMLATYGVPHSTPSVAAASL